MTHQPVVIITGGGSGLGSAMARRFPVLTHRRTRWALRLKRWWPSRYYRQVGRLAGQSGNHAA